MFVTFPSDYRPLDSPFVQAFMEGLDQPVERPKPSLGVCHSPGACAKDVDDNKESPFRGDQLD
jgi:hypothetical protein